MKAFFWSLIMMLATSATAQPIRMYVGTYTQPNKSEGIYVFDFDAATGKLTAKGLAAPVLSPSFLAMHIDREHLYSVSETGEFKGKKQGIVTAFKIEKDGKLRQQGQVGSGGSGPCHIGLDVSSSNAMVSHYGSAHITSFQLPETGGISEVKTSIQQKGSSVNPGRQKEAHAHSTWFLPSIPSLALSCDLGTDKIMLYDVDRVEGTFKPHNPESISVPPGSGPRHLTFTPSSKYMYVIEEMLCTIDTFEQTGGNFKPVHKSISTLPPGVAVSKGVSTAEILVHVSGQYLYASNRGHNSIAIFKIDNETGELSLIGHQPTGGKTPRNFNIDPTGNWLIVANQDSDNLVVFKIDRDTGKLTQTGEPVQCFAPVCLKFWQAWE